MVPIILASIISGIVVAALVLYISKNKAFKNELTPKNEKGYYVMRLKTRNRFVVFFCFSFSFIAFAFTVYNATHHNSNSLIIYLLGLFFVVVGIFMILFSVYDRIEYNDKEIKQFRIFRKEPQTIEWKDVRKVKYKSTGPLLELSSSSHYIFIDFNNDGVIQLLVFMQQKLTGENKKIIDKIIGTESRF